MASVAPLYSHSKVEYWMSALLMVSFAFANTLAPIGLSTSTVFAAATRNQPNSGPSVFMTVISGTRSAQGFTSDRDISVPRVSRFCDLKARWVILTLFPSTMCRSRRV